jgi:membrane associated rhomboid family serine protease
MNRKEWYRIITHAFLHADVTHLLFNMFTFYVFGLELEQHAFPYYFPKHAEFYFFLLYFGGMITAAFPGFEKNKNNISYNAVGASGAVSAIVFSYILINPSAKLGMLFIPIEIPASIFGVLYLLYTWYMSRKGGGRIAHDAHLWGSVFGFFFTILLKPSFLPQFFQNLMHIFQ